MDLQKEIALAYLEEDNAQRAYFRVRPLLTAGGLAEDAAKLWPDEGGLRIVPDRNEQHTFKDRMREMIPWCAVDLTAFTPEVNKIRTNKNYRPERGEVNQFIIFSDAVKAVPEDLFIEVLEGAAGDFAALAERAITPTFLIRDGDTFFGPVRKAEPVLPETAGEMEAMLFTLPCPDGTERSILCLSRPEAAQDAEPAEPAPSAPKAEPAPETAEARQPKPAREDRQRGRKNAQAKQEPADEALPIGQELTILDESKTFEETLEQLDQPLSRSANLLNQKAPEQEPARAVRAPREDDGAAPGKLTGTPLNRNTAFPSVPQAKNKAQEAVANQWRAGRSDAPAATIPAGARMRMVENPVETAMAVLEEAWANPAVRPQLAARIISMDGMQHAMERAMGTELPAGSALYRAVQKHLDDLEAERLEALVEVDRARANAQACRAEAIQSATARMRRELDGLKRDVEAHRKTVDGLKAEIASLTGERDSLKPAEGIRLSAVSGGESTAGDVLARLEKTCDGNRVPFDRGFCAAMLALTARGSDAVVLSNRPEDAAALLHRMAAALGWGKSCAVVQGNGPVTAEALPADSVPLQLIAAGEAPETPDGVQVVRVCAELPEGLPDDVPVLEMRLAAPLAAVAEESGAPLSLRGLRALFGEPAVEPEQAKEILAPAARAADLSDKALAAMAGFVSLSARLMEGGIVGACDEAICLWAVSRAKDRAAMRPLAAEYAHAMNKLR